MGLIKSLSIGIGANSKPLRKDLRRASSQVSTWASSVGKIASGVAIGNIASGVIGKGLGTITRSIESAFSFAVRDEQLETAFGTLLGGADKAKAVLSDLRDFAGSTPFEFPGIADSAKKLISFGFEQEQLLPTLTKLGDVAAGLDIPFSDLSDIYGKARVAGRVMSEDLNQLAGRGIPIFDELAKVMGVPAGEIKDLASKGKIGFAELEKAFDGMTGQGGKFAGMMAAQSQTAGGLISTLKDNWNLALGQIGAAVFETFDIKGLIGQAIGAMQGFMPTLTWLLEQAKQLGPIFKMSFRVIFSYYGMLFDIASSVIGAISSLFGGFGSVTMEGFVRGFVTALATIEFGFLNWQKVGVLVIKTIGYRLVSFGNNVIHLFTQTLPTAISWWADSGLDIMMRLAANGLTIFENLGDNIVAIFSNLPGLVSGSVSFSELLKPLNDGMIDVVTNALELPVRVEGGVEKSMREDLESLQGELSNGLTGHINTRLAELIPPAALQTPEITPPSVDIATPDAAEVLGEGQSTLANEVAKQFSGLAESGSQEYRDAILRFRGLGADAGKDKVMVQQRDLAKLQLDELKKINRPNDSTPEFSIP